MSQLEYVTITQPTDIASGSTVLFAAEIDQEAYYKSSAGDYSNTATQVDFWVFGTKKSGGSRTWHNVK
jgi:hypothetical protein